MIRTVVLHLDQDMPASGEFVRMVADAHDEVGHVIHSAAGYGSNSERASAFALRAIADVMLAANPREDK